MAKRLPAFAIALVVSLAGHGATYEDRYGKHVVEEGETLSSITEQYLGDETFWRENWKLNPDIDNPDLLVPGQVLDIIMERKVVADEARIRAISNDVDKNKSRSEWIPAATGDELAQRDGVRTLEESSAELLFTDSSILRLSEFSQVFLESKSADLRGREKGRVEIEQGAAEIEFEPLEDVAAPDIELVAGSAVARPKPDAAGEGKVRAERSSTGAAQIVVYAGSTDVESGGEKVSLAAGMGTTVPEDGPPTKPERIPDPPTDLRPAPGTVWQVANERVSWSPIDNARHYVIEVCRDPSCGELIARAHDIEETSWQPEIKQPGEYFWRVSAVSSSGLQGYPSEAASFVLETTVVDKEAPLVAIMPVGHAKRSPGEKILIGANTAVRFIARDDAAGVETI
ncbi:MAG: LysM peptidoglycan-binding domain-containing protein, partial [Xanthomonadales bacterium]|nr:LysM peptidoglycan-binding domain-containing protein [Xanthomonadales bacterium]